VIAARVKKLAEEKTTAAEQVTEELGTRSAYEMREFEAITTFDDSGAGETIRKWVEVRSAQSINNLKIHCKFQLSAGGQGQLPAIEALSGSQLGAHFSQTTRSDTVIEGNVVLEGLLAPDTGYVAFQARQSFEGAFCMTKEQTIEAYKGSTWQTEYAVSGVTAPVKTLKRSVHFPPSYKNLAPPPQAVVFLGEDEVVDSAEITRVKDGLTILERSAILVVSNPRLGRRYGISWMPPPARHG